MTDAHPRAATDVDTHSAARGRTRARTIDDLTHDELATLVRELLMDGHLIDRAGMPHLVGAYGRDVMGAIAIDEWMGASPIYSLRTQAALGFGGDGSVETIFKGMQLDIGAPPEFMDFRYVVHDHDRGEFWLDHCGALMDVEPMGDDYVRTMCHTIEDPTFDATGAATNPRAQVRPIHRPPRLPADRHPHCAWTVTVEADAEPFLLPEITDWVRATTAASLPLVTAPARAGDRDGWTDYSAPLDPDLDHGVFSTAVVRRLIDEVALQGHLLVLSFLRAVEVREGADAALALGLRQLTGVAGVASLRLARAFGLGPSPADVATAFALHPVFHPASYAGVDVTVVENQGQGQGQGQGQSEGQGDGPRVVVALRDGVGVEEPSGFCWPALLTGDGGTGVIDVIAQALDPGARAEPVAPGPGQRRAWELTFGHPPAPEPGDVTLTKFSTGVDFAFGR